MEWISTKIRFPKSGEEVITACKNKNMEDGIWLYDLCYYHSNSGWENRVNWEDVLYWTYIDEPPEKLIMAQYINKDALVAEIERRVSDLYPKNGQGMVITKILKEHYKDLKDFINTLEVKKVDLEKEFKQKYEQALGRARVWKEKSGMPVDKQGILDDIFPELKESDDERIRKEIIRYLKVTSPAMGENIEKMLDWLEKQGEQKPTDKVEPKFKVGDWIVNSEGKLRHIVNVDNTGYQTDNGWISHAFYETRYHCWTIRDVKDGDVLAVEPIYGYTSPFVAICKECKLTSFTSYCFIDFVGNFNKGTRGHSTNCVHPATKEQCDLLFQKMKEAGYEWDAEKKEVKKIKQEQTELPNGEDYGIDSLYHAARILEKTLGEVDGYQSDDGILEHKCAIEAVKRLYKQKPAWSEEDEKMLKSVISSIRISRSSCEEDDDVRDLFDNEIDWLESLEERMKGKQT